MRAGVYLNNAATAWPRAPGVVQAVAEALERVPVEAGRSSGGEGDVRGECRRRLAALLGVCDPERIVLTCHATSALNLAILGVGLRRGDRVLTSVSEHNSMLRPLRHLERERGIRVEVVGLDEAGRLDREAFQRALGRGVRLVALNHVSNVTGDGNPIEDLFPLAKARGAITLLDAAQSLGVRPVRPVAWQADLVAFTGHKGLRAPPGTGGLWVAPGVELQQVIVGGTGVRSELPLHPEELPMRLEAGTPNEPALAGLAAALRWHEASGLEARETERRRAARLRDGLRETPGVRVHGGAAGDEPGPIVSFCLRGWEPGEAGEALREGFGIICRTGLHCAPLMHGALGSAPRGTIRFSPSSFTGEGELEGALRAVRRLAA